MALVRWTDGGVALSVCSMRYVAAYLLAVLGGKNAPTAKDIEKILGSVGIEAETDKITKIINELKGKDVEEVIAAGMLAQLLITFKDDPKHCMTWSSLVVLWP